ncbi:EamA family transporter [uncultured Sphingomonas sp.]|uniref:EamA family transporter n=1 Tax=uncultured Sphingomonas sp. TaxID=158754 RepID=UPI0035C9547D
MTATRAVDFSFVAATIALSVYGQIALKWRLDQLGPLPAGAGPALRRLLVVLFDPVVASTFVAAFAASLAWMAALTRFELSRIYPFTSLSFVLVLLIGAFVLGERLDWSKIVGVALIVIGTAVVSAGPR